MPKISMLIPEADLNLIDGVSENRTAFMIETAVAEAKRRRRRLDDAEIARICRANAERDRALAKEWEPTLRDGLSK